MIPLPNTFGHEQEKNAQLVAGIGLGEILEQKNLSGESLERLIDKMVANRRKYLINASAAKKLIHLNAAKAIAREIEKLT